MQNRFLLTWVTLGRAVFIVIFIVLYSEQLVVLDLLMLLNFRFLLRLLSLLLLHVFT